MTAGRKAALAPVRRDCTADCLPSDRRAAVLRWVPVAGAEGGSTARARGRGEGKGRDEEAVGAPTGPAGTRVSWLGMPLFCLGPAAICRLKLCVTTRCLSWVIFLRPPASRLKTRWAVSGSDPHSGLLGISGGMANILIRASANGIAKPEKHTSFLARNHVHPRKSHAKATRDLSPPQFPDVCVDRTSKPLT